MQTIEYRDVIDRSRFGSGPWDDEPDKIQFQDEETGLPCLIKRNTLGALCGYVGVTKGHPCFEKDYDDAYNFAEIAVHGGLTYSEFCQEGEESKTICHVPAPGEAERVWWLGFDCAHGGDLVPSMAQYRRELQWRTCEHKFYRDVAYVRGEVQRLARQLKSAETLDRNPEKAIP